MCPHQLPQNFPFSSHLPTPCLVVDWLGLITTEVWKRKHGYVCDAFQCTCDRIWMHCLSKIKQWNEMSCLKAINKSYFTIFVSRNTVRKGHILHVFFFPFCSRLSYRTGQDTANCDTCRNSACIIYRWAIKKVYN